MSLGISSNKTSNIKGRYKPLNEINVTPLVDVMLVLLVVFMITAPLLTVGVEIDLPKADAPGLSNTLEPLSISIDNEGVISVEERITGLTQLPTILASLSNNNKKLRILVRADRNLRYEEVLQVLGTIVNAGFTNMILQSQIPN